MTLTDVSIRHGSLIHRRALLLATRNQFPIPIHVQISPPHDALLPERNHSGQQVFQILISKPFLLALPQHGFQLRPFFAHYGFGSVEVINVIVVEQGVGVGLQRGIDVVFMIRWDVHGGYVVELAVDDEGKLAKESRESGVLGVRHFSRGIFGCLG